MSNRITPIRYVVRFPNQAYPVSYNVGLGLKQAQFYADLCAKTHRGAIWAQDANGNEEMIGSYVRESYAQPRSGNAASGAAV